MSSTKHFSQPGFDHDRFFAGAERILTDGVQTYYESQLETLPDKDEKWPDQACGPRGFEPYSLPRLELPVTA